MAEAAAAHAKSARARSNLRMSRATTDPGTQISHRPLLSTPQVTYHSSTDRESGDSRSRPDRRRGALDVGVHPVRIELGRGRQRCISWQDGRTCVPTTSSATPRSSKVYFGGAGSSPASSRSTSLRVCTLPELAALLDAAGLALERTRGGFDGSEHGPHSPRLIITARRGRG
jgi:hypothetical protein